MHPQRFRSAGLIVAICLEVSLSSPIVAAADPAATTSDPSVREYHNILRRIDNPPPLLADHPEYVQPIEEVRRFEAPSLITDAGADLSVRAWRYSYNARGIIEIPNLLDARKTAIIVVHPWGIDDAQGWKTPEPAGVAFFCTPEKNAIARRHAGEVINPFLKAHREAVGLVLYSLTGQADPIRMRLYRSTERTPSASERAAAREELTRVLEAFDYRGDALPHTIPLTSGKPVIDYFRALPGLDASPAYDGDGFWSLPIPVMDTIEVADEDVVFYDGQGYAALRDFLKEQGIEHVLLCGYATDMCVCSTTAGYENLRQDFNVFLVGDATLATFPANQTPAYATNQAVSFASLNLLITQASWVQTLEKSTASAVPVNKAVTNAESAGGSTAAGLPAAESDDGFIPLFDGQSLAGWSGAVDGYTVEDGAITCIPEKGGNLYTEQEFANFVLRFDCRFDAGGNNGIGIRVPAGGHPSRDGIEIQILDNTAPEYASLAPYQYHGSVYGIVPAKRGYLKPVGAWNKHEIRCEGRHIVVILNDEVIVDADLDQALANGASDGRDHTGALRSSGHIVLCGHGTRVQFRDVRIKVLDAAAAE